MLKNSSSDLDIKCLLPGSKSKKRTEKTVLGEQTCGAIMGYMIPLLCVGAESINTRVEKWQLQW